MKQRQPVGTGRRMVLGLLASALLAPLMPGAVGAQVEELFSRHVQVFRPVGEFAPNIIKLSPPGAGWQEVDGKEHGFRLRLPPAAKLDATVKESRVLHVMFAPEGPAPRPELRIDAFTPEPGEPTAVDPDYADDYAEEYPKSFKGKFKVTDQGTLVIGKQKARLAYVGGTYLQGAVSAYRMQCAYLSPKRQIFLTFDCSEADWERYSTEMGQILLSFEGTAKGK